MSVWIPVACIAEVCNPFEGCPWGVPVTMDDVAEALAENRLVAHPGTADHAGRIAFLVINEAHDPIDIDVGVPSLGHHVEWITQDGNHRVAAAIYAGRAYIGADIGGSMEYARALFGVDCEEPLDDEPLVDAAAHRRQRREAMEVPR